MKTQNDQKAQGMDATAGIPCDDLLAEMRDGFGMALEGLSKSMSAARQLRMWATLDECYAASSDINKALGQLERYNAANVKGQG